MIVRRKNYSVWVSVVDQCFGLTAPFTRVFIAVVVVTVIGRGVGAKRVFQQFTEASFTAVASEVVSHATTNKAVEVNGRGGVYRSFHVVS